MQFLGGMTREDFLKEFWEKKPLLIRGAVADIESYASSEDLKELAMDEDFESRIVYNSKEISVKDGPLNEEDFNKHGWTLACHNLNLLDKNFYNLQKIFSFLPDWLFDDIMATYSKEDATIGAHIDKYNVFILQGNGKRKWELQENPDHTYKEGINIKILENFNPTIEWILEPGDMIYIPSNVAHRGTSLTESISYSLGFKSLEDERIFQSYLNDLSINFESDEYLKDKTKKPVVDPYIIDNEISEYFHNKMTELVTNKEQFNMWFTSFLSTPRGQIEPGQVYLEEDIINLAKHNSIYKDIFTKIAVTKRDDDFAVAVNNQLYALSNDSYTFFKQWMKSSPQDPVDINFDELDNELWPLVIDMFKSGTLYFSED